MTQNVTHTDQEWREKLTPEQYKVLREAGTEAPFTGKYVHNKKDGAYTCGACGAMLFDSSTKFDSGSGWPSFTNPADTTGVQLREDRSHFMVRTEVLCASCGSHLGHLFDDGPRAEGGKRFCINSCALDFTESG